jgi:hypothetical protein
VISSSPCPKGPADGLSSCGAQQDGRLRVAESRDQLPSANFSTVPTAPTQTYCRDVSRGRGRQTRRGDRARRRQWIPTLPPGACSRYLYGAEEPRMFMFPSLLAGAKDQPWPLQRPEDQPSSGQGSTLLLRWRIEEELPPSR